MTLSLDESLALARTFAAHIRDPKNSAHPVGVPEDRMSVYRSLFFSSMTGFLDETYEHLQRLLGPEWAGWQRRFFADYSAQSPYFHRISSEFLRYIQSCPSFQPALLDLARYEQCLYDVEVLAQYQYEPLHRPEAVLAADVLLGTKIILNPQLRIEGFEYDIPNLLVASERCAERPIEPSVEPSVEWLAALKAPIFFGMYKTKLGRVSTQLLAPMTVALLTSFETETTAEQALNSLAKAAQVDVVTIEKFGLDFICDALGTLLSTVPNTKDF